MSDTNLATPMDSRPARGSWAPGGYYNHCRECGKPYIGDKRSTMCAPCAYTQPEPLKDLINLPPERRVVAVINHAFGGVHHTSNFKRHDESAAPYWTCTVAGTLCNFDFDNMSRLVVSSLEYGVRVEISGGGPHRLSLKLFPRFYRDGQMHQRIPRLEYFVKGFDYNTRLADAS